ncbi:phosphatase PAP2 family protein [Xanthobacter sp. TB0136]|uniref:phosphatase PAP2 family protein n=1 Tax=Xanthobacter sp. TB0136 TaxID=3459177 RepID=UPI004039D43A
MDPWAKTFRAMGHLIPWITVAPAFVVIIAKFLFPHVRMLIPARAAILLALTMAAGPGLLVNGIFKETWDRPRPVHVEQFGGTHGYQPWYDPTGSCSSNCSFVSGEGALSFWMLAPASLVPPGPLRILALSGAVAFGVLVGGLRIGFGGHFFTDVVFSGVLVVTLIALTRYWLYDRRNAPTDTRVERTIARAGLSTRRGFSRLCQTLRLRPGRHEGKTET